MQTKRIERTFPFLAVFLAMLTPGPSALAQMAESIPTTTERSTAMTPPKTVDDLWTRILTLLAKNRGFVSKQDVEETLGMNFTHTEKDDEKRVPRLGAQCLHRLGQDLPGIGHLRVALVEDPTEIVLSFGWQPIGEMRPAYIELDKARQDLRDLGWTAGSRTVAPGESSQSFWRNEDYAESQKPDGKPLDVFRWTSEVNLLMPDQISPLVNGLSMVVYKH